MLFLQQSETILQAHTLDPCQEMAKKLGWTCWFTDLFWIKMKKLFLQLALCLALTSMTSSVIKAEAEMCDSQPDSNMDTTSNVCGEPFSFMDLIATYQKNNTSYTDLKSANKAAATLGNPAGNTPNPNAGTGQSLALTTPPPPNTNLNTNAFLGQLAFGYVAPMGSSNLALIFSGNFGLSTAKKDIEVTRTYLQVNPTTGAAGAPVTEMLPGKILSNLNFGADVGAGVFLTPKTLASLTVGYTGQRQSTTKSGLNAENKPFSSNIGYCLNGIKFAFAIHQFVSERMAIGLQVAYVMYANRVDSPIYSYENAYATPNTEGNPLSGTTAFEQSLNASSLSNNSLWISVSTRFIFPIR